MTALILMLIAYQAFKPEKSAMEKRVTRARNVTFLCMFLICLWQCGVF